MVNVCYYIPLIKWHASSTIRKSCTTSCFVSTNCHKSCRTCYSLHSCYALNIWVSSTNNIVLCVYGCLWSCCCLWDSITNTSLANKHCKMGDNTSTFKCTLHYKRIKCWYGLFAVSSIWLHRAKLYFFHLVTSVPYLFLRHQHQVITLHESQSRHLVMSR